MNLALESIGGEAMNRVILMLVLVLALMPLACSKADSPGHLRQAEQFDSGSDSGISDMGLPPETPGGAAPIIVTKHDSIQEAVTSASDGDQIRLTKGTWNENVVIGTSLRYYRGWFRKVDS